MHLKSWLKDHHIPVRLLLSVVAGIVFSKVLTVITHFILHKAGVMVGVTEPMFDFNQLVISLAFHSVYGVAGAYLTAYLAREQARKAVFVLGTKELIMWLIGLVLLWKHAPLWFNLAKAALGIPLAILGGRIYLWHKGIQNEKLKIRNANDGGGNY